MALWRTWRARGPDLMKMELIQPFINSADAVLAQGLQCSTSIGSLSMEEEAYRRKGVAAMVWVTGDIEGRIIIDLDPETAVRVASKMAGAQLPESDSLVRETACELANQIIGNVFMNIAMRYNRKRQADRAAAAAGN